jgi:hypothetical protein
MRENKEPIGRPQIYRISFKEFQPAEKDNFQNVKLQFE